MPVFEILILEHPTEAEKKDGKLEKIIADKKIVAADKDRAFLTVVRDSDELKKADLNRVEVIIRPFSQ